MPHRQSAHPYAAVMICTRALTMIRPPANLGTAEGAPRVSPRFSGTPSLAQQTGINVSLQVLRVLDCCIYGSSVRSNGTLTWVLSLGPFSIFLKNATRLGSARIVPVSSGKRKRPQPSPISEKETARGYCPGRTRC